MQKNLFLTNLRVNLTNLDANLTNWHEKCYNKTGCIDEIHGSGRPHLLADVDIAIILDLVRQNSSISLRKMAGELNLKQNKDVCKSTNENYLFAENLRKVIEKFFRAKRNKSAVERHHSSPQMPCVLGCIESDKVDTLCRDLPHLSDHEVDPRVMTFGKAPNGICLFKKRAAGGPKFGT
ncbi:hypothetical protein ENBRE01_2062 [Enteropsectra breve]|nr:hypothetical protein ENBRE01_2062 [Enteropsectra breve]